MFKLRSNLTTDGISHNILPVSVYAKLFPPIFSSSGQWVYPPYNKILESVIQQSSGFKQNSE